MDGRRGGPQASVALAYDAEALIRSLAGVVAAHVRAGDRGIDTVHVTAASDDDARRMAGHVRSALLAGLATPVTAARIHVRVDPDARSGEVPPAHNGNGNGHAPAPDPVDPDADATDDDAPDAVDGHRHRIWLVESRPQRSRLPGRFLDDDDHDDAPEPRAGATAVAGGMEETHDRAAEPPRLVAVDVDRPGDGRVVCRVAVAYGTLVHRAEAVAVDLPGAAAQAAAQAAVRALVDAGIDGLELVGLREVEIAGRDYVLVALRRTDTSRRHRSGSAPIVGSAERSAAEAAVAAADDLI